MVELTPENVEAVNALNRKDIPALKALDEILLGEMRPTCRLDIPLRTKQDFQKIAEVLSTLAGRLALIASRRDLSTLEALRMAKTEVDGANRLFRIFCPATKSGSHTQE